MALADAFSAAFDNLSGAAINMGADDMNQRKAMVADQRGWAAKMVQAWGRQHGADHSVRNRLILNAIKIFNSYEKTPFKDFPYKYQFIFNLLEIAGVDTKQKRAITLQIQSCCRQNWLR